MKLKLKAEKTGRWHDAPHTHERPHAHRGNRYRILKLWRPAGYQLPSNQDREHCETNHPVYGYSKELLTAFERAAKEAPCVSMETDILDGQPCIAGTRIPVHSVLRAIEHYGSLDAAVKCYPHLTIPQVKDALYFAQVVLEPADGVNETKTAS
jgi:uncharacterized protein (DUF433 family)